MLAVPEGLVALHPARAVPQAPVVALPERVVGLPERVVGLRVAVDLGAQRRLRQPRHVPWRWRMMFLR